MLEELLTRILIIGLEFCGKPWECFMMNDLLIIVLSAKVQGPRQQSASFTPALVPSSVTQSSSP